MKTIIFILIAASVLRINLNIQAQGYVVPNGILTNYSGAFLPGEISVLHNPVNTNTGFAYTGFALEPVGKTQPTVFTNTFHYDFIVDVGVRVFLVSSNDAISLQPIIAHTWTELGNAANYIFANGAPFYVGLYTGNDQFAPPDGIYNNPLFGWALLVNNRGVIQVLDSALEYNGGGIFAGTQTIIPAPEPSALALAALGGGIFGLRRYYKK